MKIIFIFISVLFIGCSNEPTPTSEVKSTATPSSTNAKIYKITVDSLLLTADSIIIVSHESTDFPIQNAATGKSETPELLINGKPNWGIVHEKKLLTQKDRLVLRNLLLSPIIIDSEIVQTKCFEPRHAAFLYKTDKISYIDFCFQCVGFAVSPDISGDNLKFDNEKFKTLRLFLVSKGLKYALE